LSPNRNFLIVTKGISVLQDNFFYGYILSLQKCDRIYKKKCPFMAIKRSDTSVSSIYWGSLYSSVLVCEICCFFKVFFLTCKNYQMSSENFIPKLKNNYEKIAIIVGQNYVCFVWSLKTNMRMINMEEWISYLTDVNGLATSQVM
jgi:hypothetical protein